MRYRIVVIILCAILASASIARLVVNSEQKHESVISALEISETLRSLDNRLMLAQKLSTKSNTIENKIALEEESEKIKDEALLLVEYLQDNNPENLEILLFLASITVCFILIFFILRDIKKNIAKLIQSISLLSSMSSNLVEGSEKVVTRFEDVTQGAQQMSQHIGGVAASSEEININTRNLNVTAERMAQNMNTVAQSIKGIFFEIAKISNSANEGDKIATKAKALSSDASLTMESLGSSAQEIGHVTDVIMRMAQQTNLLAINASIEAASAGDAGRGFAVVASEIKELATQSSQAAEDIAIRINAVQKTSEKAVLVISNITTIINTIHDYVKMINQAVIHQQQTSETISTNVVEANNGVNIIAQSLADIARGTAQISMNIAQIAEDANDVVRNISGVETAAKTTRQGSKNLQRHTENIASLANQLSGLTRPLGKILASKNDDEAQDSKKDPTP